MSRFNTFLLTILLLQIFVASAIYFSHQPAEVDPVHTVLLEVKKEQIDRISLVDETNRQTTLEKVAGQWLLPDYYNLPANQHKVTNMLNTLATTQSGWPVATTESARQRFKLAEGHFNKKLVLSHGDEPLQTLYLGTSPGFRQLHVRRNEEKEIYVVKLNSHDFPTQQANWLDNTLLQLNGDITRLEGPDYAFLRSEQQWLTEKGEGEAMNEEIDKLALALSQITIQSAEEPPSSEAAYTLEATVGENVFRYHFFEDDNTLYIQRNDYEPVFKISKSDYEKITKKTATQLVKHDANDVQPESQATHATISEDNPDSVQSSSPEDKAAENEAESGKN